MSLNFTDILAVAKEWLFHGLPWQPLFHDVKISDFVTGRSGVSYIIELSRMLNKNLLPQANNAQIFHFSRWGTLTPPYKI